MAAALFSRPRSRRAATAIAQASLHQPVLLTLRTSWAESRYPAAVQSVTLSTRDGRAL